MTPITPAATTRITTIADITGSSKADWLVDVAAGVACPSSVGVGCACGVIASEGGCLVVVGGVVSAGTMTAGLFGTGDGAGRGGGGALVVAGAVVGSVVVGGVVGTVVGGGV